MIQIYSPGNEDFEKNGDMTLCPLTANVHAVLKGTWTAELKHPIDSQGRWKYIENEAVVKMPSFNGIQMFRIKKVKKNDDGIEATMEPIFMDARDDCYFRELRHLIQINGQEALDFMIPDTCKYSGISDITKTKGMMYSGRNLIEIINGDDNNSYINRWGGEPIYDNFKVIINTRAGKDTGFEIRYGKNVKKNGITEEIDTSDVVTRIYPYAYGGGYSYEDESGNEYIDSPNIGKYPNIKNEKIVFSDVKMEEDATDEDKYDNSGIIICKTREELMTAFELKCGEQYKNGIDKPKVTLKIDMVSLRRTKEYSEYEELENISLGDTVRCVHHRLDIATYARITEITYDSVRKCIQNIVVGEVRKDSYFSKIFERIVTLVPAIQNKLMKL